MLTREEPCPGLFIYQPKRGFRYSMDPFLLASWALEGGSPVSALDCGSGSGVMTLLLARAGIKATGVDVREEWAELSARSASESGLEATFITGDIRELGLSGFELALMNPPYLEQGAGPASPDPWKAAARTELNGGLAQLCAAAASAAARVCVVIKQQRAGSCEQGLEAAGLVITRRLDIDRSLSLIEGSRSGTRSFEQAQMRGPSGWSERVQGLYQAIGASLR